MERKVIYLLFLCNLIFPDIQAQPEMSRKEANAIVDLLHEELRRAYLFPEKVNTIEIQLTALKASWSSDSIESNALIQGINSIMFKETGDQHLRFYYDLEKFNLFEKENTEVIDSAEKEIFRKVNFGVQKFEILAGNIAYLKLNKFQKFEDAQNVLAAAIDMMSNADAVVLDLRNNGGGDGRTKEFLYSFFLIEQQWDTRWKQEFFDWNQIEEFKKQRPHTRRLENVPLCVLTGGGTFSAAEGFCYDLQFTQRAKIVGVKTKGGGHSGSSVALDKGFLVFIPTEGQESPIEGKGVTPDFPVSESMAFWKAQEIIIADLIKNCEDNACEKNMKWVQETVLTMLKNNETEWKMEKQQTGNYSKGFVIAQQGKKYVIEQKKMGLSSVLIPIEENYWLALDLEDFGFGNYRIRFFDGGKAKLYVNIGTMVAELDIEKE